MTKMMISLTVALAATLFSSNTAEARRWAYITPAPARFYVAPRVVYRPLHPVLIPTTTTVFTPTITPTLTPNVVVGPRGHLHYVAPIQPIAVGPNYVW
jgi:hypothetical protein